jgi:hypothetical protein
MAAQARVHKTKVSDMEHQASIIRQFHAACEHGNVGAVHKILSQHQPSSDKLDIANSTNPETGWTPTHYAMRDENLALLAVLLSHGASIEQQVNDPRDLLMAKSRQELPSLGKNIQQVNDPRDLLMAKSRQELRSLGKSTPGASYVFSCGKSDFQLGYVTGESVAVQRVPRLVPNLIGVKQLAAARYHTVAVLNNGQVCTWGVGTGGRLGHGNEYTLFAPTVVEALKSSSVVALLAVAGDSHTMVLASTGVAFAWGVNKHGQLGIGGGGSGNGGGGAKLCVKPTLPLDEDRSSTQGESPAAVDVLPASNCADSSTTCQLTPKRVRPPPESRKFVALACSSTHSVALCSSGRVYTWGCNSHGQLGHRDAHMSGKRVQYVPKVVDHLERIGVGNGTSGSGRGSLIKTIQV